MAFMLVVPEVVGHRGAAGVFLEHTLEGYDYACGERRVAGAECDVLMTADGKLVVFHDYETDRLLGVSGRVENFTLDQLRKYDLIGNKKGKKGLKVPTFAEYIETVIKHSEDGYKPKFFVEFKFDGDATAAQMERVVGATMEEVAKYGAQERTVYMSFNHASLLHVRKIDSNTRSKLGVLMEGLPAKPETMLKIVRDAGADYFMPYYETINREMVDAAHAEELKVSVWTVNTPEQLQKMLVAGVDAVTTDYPEQIQKHLESLRN